MTSQTPTLALGVCDYPEHVPVTDWQKHAEQQKALGLTYVRLAEFSWAKMEPSDGHYDWQWLDEAISIYQQHGLNVVLGTPTATPPAWLIQKYPEILPVDEMGLVKRFGSRRHYDHASDVYRKESQRIITQMAERYGEHEAVIGWQTDNELGHEGTTQSYGGDSARKFPLWLERKYGSLEALNQAWGTDFWSQTYTDWAQIEPPFLSAARQANPSQVLDFKRFCSDMVCEYQQLQVDILRRHSPGRFITHNCVIYSAEIDLYKLAEPLDFISWDSYPIGMLELFATWESEEIKTRYARTGYPDLVSVNHDIYRGLKKGKDFWVMEQQCGFANWAAYNPLPAEGAVALWTAQAWAHGAESVVYFRWRACHMAQEIMHSGLLKQDGSPDRGIPEVEGLDPSLFNLSPAKNRVALLNCYDSLWIYNQQPHNVDLDYWRQFMLFYTVCRSLGVDVDILHPSQVSAGSYDVVIAPALTLVSDETAQVLSDLSETSKLILGPRTAFRTASGTVQNDGQFDNIRELVGARQGNFDSMRPTLSQMVVDDSGSCYEASLWAESYIPTTADMTHQYSGGPLDGLPAVIRHNNTTVIGALSNSLVKAVIEPIFNEAGIATQALPEGVRLSRRGDKTLVTNFNQHEVQLGNQTLPPVSFKLVD